MMYRATTRRDRVDSIIEVPVDDAMTLADRLSKIAAEAAKLAVDDHRKSQASKTDNVFSRSRLRADIQT